MTAIDYDSEYQKIKKAARKKSDTTKNNKTTKINKERSVASIRSTDISTAFHSK